MNFIQKKICLLGDFAVGKTSLVRRFVEGRFDEKYLSTIGVKISRRKMITSNKEMNLIIWDLAGGDDFNAQSSYLRGAAGAIIVCDLTRYETLGAIERYASQFRQVNKSASLVFVGNKVDLVEERVISNDDLHAMCSALEGAFYLTSAKTGEQVEACFYHLAEALEKVT